MSVTVPVDLSHALEVRVSAGEVFAVPADKPTSASHRLKVDKLVDLGGNRYCWELHRVGSAKLQIQTRYAAAHAADRKKLTLRWTPVEGVGNARLGGSWTLTRKKNSTHILLKVRGEITVPLPGLMNRLVAPVVPRENEKLIEQDLHNLTERFGGKV